MPAGVNVDVRCRCLFTGSGQAGGAPQVPYWKKGPHANSLQSKEGLLVTVAQGQIAQEQVDVIVNTTSSDLNLGNGGVSSSILKAAGASIEQEAKQAYPGGLATGQIAITSGGNLPVQHIYHGALPNWNTAGSDVVCVILVHVFHFFRSVCCILWSRCVCIFSIFVMYKLHAVVIFTASTPVCCAVPGHC